MESLKISPSMMCADFLNIKACLDIFSEEGIDYLHIDVMDGHYVPNIGLGADFCRVLAGYTDIPLDIHLMVENVDLLIPQFAEFAHAVISFHPEVSRHPLRTIQLIHSFGARAGVALDPSLNVEQTRYLLSEADMVCVMTVNPGFAGQEVIPGMIEKLGNVSAYCRKMGYAIEVEVDGNVSWENIPKMVKAGADVFVAGTSSIFMGGTDMGENIKRFQSLISTGEI